MAWWSAGLWGLLGAAAVELLDFYKLMRAPDGEYRRLPVTPAFWAAYGLAVAIRLVLGFVTGWALFSAGEVDSALATMLSGAGVTGIVEHIARSRSSMTVENLEEGAASEVVHHTRERKSLPRRIEDTLGEYPLLLGTLKTFFTAVVAAAAVVIAAILTG